MAEQVKYLAKYNRVWRNRKTGALLGQELTLPKGESLIDYEQVPEPAKKKAVGDLPLPGGVKGADRL